ncbi:hypothetical protein KEM55_004874 [Ascosphaera atra]|nr:hypothetical protein KEM55_004874 [Ascosphaera atra]
MSIRRSNTTATAATAATARTTGTVETSATSLSENDLPEGTVSVKHIRAMACMLPHSAFEHTDATPFLSAYEQPLIAYEASFTDLNSFPFLQTAHLLVERLRAWKHACGYLEDYCESMEKMQKKHASEMEKVAKTVENELRERPQFDDSPNGFAALFRTLHDNTQNVANLHLETERQLRTVVRPILSNLHSDIKAKSKETNDASAKTFKKVEKTRQETQKVLEALGTQSSHFEVSTDKPSTSNDPLIIDRHVQHKFNKQINEENNNLNELKATQERMRQYEVRTVEMLQQAFGRLNETIRHWHPEHGPP